MEVGGGGGIETERETGRATSLTISAHLSNLKGSGGKRERMTQANILTFGCKPCCVIISKGNVVGHELLPSAIFNAQEIGCVSGI